MVATIPGIYTREDIEKEIDNNRIIKFGAKEYVKANSYDMRVGTVFLNGEIIKEGHARGNERFQIKPGETISLLTMEELHLPDDMTALAFPMNSQSKRGLLVLNPGLIDPNSKGPLTVVAINLSIKTLEIFIGMPIFTVILQSLPKGSKTDFERNVDREEREREFNETVIVNQPKRGLLELIEIRDDCKFMDEEQSEKFIETLKKEAEKDRLRSIEVLGIFAAAIAFIISSVQILRSNFLFHEALLLIPAIALGLISFVLGLHIIVVERKPFVIYFLFLLVTFFLLSNPIIYDSINKLVSSIFGN